MDTTAKDIMTSELITISEGTNIEDALKLLINNRITGLPVVGKKGELVGVLSEFDIIQQLSKHKKMKPEIFHSAIEFSRHAECIPETMPLGSIVKLFVESKFRRVPVMDKKGKLSGIITRRDLMKIFYYRARLS